ncbi:phycobiliprotein lyase [Tolypothrix sp. FACHB-123]|uniref:phycobiliprotein lyase n=1 Tax=Tolypothrix sp. FACHB-123 TaxID=2692868 RepID=UPI001689B7A8|nr:phycobiliprotein lyase [Tolypothrix sp. FACHB-123]MBD2353103.1 phycobiliprotein lyase [Tolypothrix sp. FACHB-123]
MNIEEFFELSAGKWFSHRTSHILASKESQSGKSNIIIEMLTADHPEVIKLCQINEVNPSSAACAIKVTGGSAMTGDKEKHSGTTVLVSVPDADNPNQGKLLWNTGNAEKAPVAGRYKIGSDEALTLTVESETMWTEERLWFASPNLRMRVSVIKHQGGYNMSSFTSEIRMGGAPANTKAAPAANAASS